MVILFDKSPLSKDRKGTSVGYGMPGILPEVGPHIKKHRVKSKDFFFQKNPFFWKKIQKFFLQKTFTPRESPAWS